MEEKKGPKELSLCRYNPGHMLLVANLVEKQRRTPCASCERSVANPSPSLGLSKRSFSVSDAGDPLNVMDGEERSVCR